MNFSSVQGEGSLCSRGKQRPYVVGRISVEARISRGKGSLELESWAEVTRARMPPPEVCFEWLGKETMWLFIDLRIFYLLLFVCQVCVCECVYRGHLSCCELVCSFPVFPVAFEAGSLLFLPCCIFQESWLRAGS